MLTRPRRLFAAIACILLSRPLSAAFDDQDRQLPWARDAGSASAFNPVRGGVEALGLNPAAMGFGEEAVVSASGGNGGTTADLVGTLGVLWPFADDLGLGVAYRHVQGAGGPGFGERSLGFSAAHAPFRGLSLGLRPWLHQAASPGAGSSANGFSLDAGVLLERPMSRRFQAQAGWWGSQLASEWPDRHWRRSVPVAQRAGLAVRFNRWGALGAALEQSTRLGSSDAWNWRAGLEFDRFSRLRASFGASSDPAARWSAGLQGGFFAWGGRHDVSYALLVPGADGGLRHRLQLSTGFQVRSRSTIVAVPLRVAYEPGTRRVRSATVSLNVDSNSEVKDWELEIRDKSGRLVRVISGSGTPPALVTWDGKDALGEALGDGEEVSYRLNIKTPSGLRSSAPSHGIEARLGTAGLDQLEVGGPGPLVVPVLDEDGQPAQLLLRPPSIPGRAERWQVLIQGAHGETLRVLEGSGELPTELLWDGKDADGGRALPQEGLRIRFNAWDEQGQVHSLEQRLDAGLQPVLDEEEPLPRLGLKLPALREGGLPLTLLLSDGSLRPLSEAPPVVATPLASRSPTRTPQAIATPSPASLPTPEPITPVPTARPTERPTPVPTALPTAVPTPVASPQPRLAVPSTGIGVGLGRANYLSDPGLIPPVYMTREQAEGPRARGVPATTLRRRLPSAIDGVLDVFMPASAEIDPAKAEKLQAFLWRLRGYDQRRILLTGLVGPGEEGGEALSRGRVRELSRLMVEEGAFKGEFILKVDGRQGPQKGVKIDVLRR